MNFIRTRNFRAGPQTSLEGFICPQNSDKQQKIKVFGRSGGGAEVIFADVNSYMKNFSYYHIDHIHFENKAKIEIARFMKNYI